MKKLDLKQIGVQELTFAENSQIDGGCPICWGIVGSLLALAIDSLDAMVEGYAEGRASHHYDI